MAETQEVGKDVGAPLRVYITCDESNWDIMGEIILRLRRPELLIIDATDNKAERGLSTELRNATDVFVVLLCHKYLSGERSAAEMTDIIKAVADQPYRLIPVLIDECDWRHSPFAPFQVYPVTGIPFSKGDDKKDIIEGLGRALLSIYGIQNNEWLMTIIREQFLKKNGNLTIFGRRLKFIPWHLNYMPWLTDLDLTGNKIEVIENLQNLNNLKSLWLDDNQITQIPPLPYLSNLHTLSVSNNKIKEIPDLSKNKKLKDLYLFSNQIKRLPDDFRFYKLRRLSLGNNNIESLEDIKAAFQIKELYVAENPFTSLKPFLPELKKGRKAFLSDIDLNNQGDGICIEEVPVSEPPMEVIKQGNEAIINYFEAAAKYDTAKLEVAKLILVGNSDTGKSDLSKFLRSLPISTTHDSTELLDIQAWRMEISNSESTKPMLVNIFDFGGQDYYHDSHRMYYSHDTAYVLMWEGKTNKYSVMQGADSDTDISFENFPLAYWLESIRFSLGKKSKHQLTRKDEGDELTTMTDTKGAPVLVLQNKIETGEAFLNQDDIVKKYNNVHCFFSVSLRYNQRTGILPDVIKEFLVKLNPTGRVLITYEHKIVKDFIDNRRAFKMISLAEFKDECIKIINDQSIKFTTQNAIIIAEILDSIGEIFYDKDENNDGLIFTRVKEFNDTIKDIMGFARKGSDKGIFNVLDVKHIPYKDEVLRLLVKNYSIIKLNDNEYLAPQFLPINPDASIQHFLPLFAYNQVRFVYEAYFHKSVLLTLFSKYLTDKVGDAAKRVKSLPFWRNGIIVSRNDERVYVEFLKEKDRCNINIRTLKPYSKTGLERDIERQLEELSDGWTHYKEVSVDSKHFFAVNELKKGAEAKVYEFSQEDKVTKERFFFSVNDFKNLVEFEHLPAKLFISYSSKNSDYVKRLVTHLEPLRASGLIDVWYDRMIVAGNRWDETIRAEMRSSDMVIFLLSPDLLANDYVIKTEIPLAAEQMGALPGVPNSKFYFVELKPCGWKYTVLKDYQLLLDMTKTDKSVISIGEPENDTEWNKVIDALVAKIKILHPSKNDGGHPVAIDTPYTSPRL